MPDVTSKIILQDLGMAINKWKKSQLDEPNALRHYHT